MKIALIMMLIIVAIFSGFIAGSVYELKTINQGVGNVSAPIACHDTPVTTYPAGWRQLKSLLCEPSRVRLRVSESDFVNNATQA
jgi:hypothetical protein